MNKNYFINIFQQVYCNDSGVSIEYSSDGNLYKTRGEAITQGYDYRGSDDFNIGVIENGKLVSFDWMYRLVDNSEEVLAEVSKALDLEYWDFE